MKHTGDYRSLPSSWLTPEVNCSAYILLWLSETPCCKTAGIGGPGLYRRVSVILTLKKRCVSHQQCQEISSLVEELSAVAPQESDAHQTQQSVGNQA